MKFSAITVGLATAGVVAGSLVTGHAATATTDQKVKVSTDITRVLKLYAEYRNGRGVVTVTQFARVSATVIGHGAPWTETADKSRTRTISRARTNPTAAMKAAERVAKRKAKKAAKKAATRAATKRARRTATFDFTNPFNAVVAQPGVQPCTTSEVVLMGRWATTRLPEMAAKPSLPNLPDDQPLTLVCADDFMVVVMSQINPDTEHNSRYGFNWDSGYWGCAGRYPRGSNPATTAVLPRLAYNIC